ncbi:MBOAT family O-acyltransferase [Rhabdothermincola salaria]|uniref:MBOAT family O-acyltransferase n=1 Tax=Rhabdothermincola salaria TaxID=2903142 RepID=UPI001E39FC5B|nr:MBOAT family protein [Rhabdothermincola salaria]MCD9623509.1 MBOAT family protein [Rhabdothermincola salaria]
MLFPTIDFAVFFVVVFTASWLLRPRHTVWRWFMLAASCYFYAYWEFGYLFLLLGSIGVNWLFGEAVYRALGPDGQRTTASKWLVRASVVVNLAALGYYKYLDFFVSSVSDRLESLGLDVDPPVLEILLPVGISFFTFQAMSYVLDIGRGEWRRPMTLLDFAVFLSFFPQVVAGPIVRASEFAPQLERPADPRFVRYSEAFMLIFRGLFKKVVISSFLAAQIVDPVFAVPEAYGRWEVLWAIYAYAIQIYADFSGYTDIAIGVALLLGFRFPQNFNAPYIATSLQDFWRRWHMTLSRWLRDYLYIPLGGNRGTTLFTYRNLFLVMLIGGLWHGANWTFVVWGAIHGGYLVAERVVKTRWAARGSLGLPAPLVKGLQWFLTFNVVCLAWVFFRAPSVGDAWTMLGRLFAGGGAPSVVSTLVLVTVVLSLASQFVPPRVAERGEQVFSKLAPLAQAAILAVGLVVIDALGPEGVAPFIYFQF